MTFAKPAPGSRVRITRQRTKGWRHPTERKHLTGIVQPDAPHTRDRHFVIKVNCPKVPYRTIDLDKILDLEYL